MPTILLVFAGVFVWMAVISTVGPGADSPEHGRCLARRHRLGPAADRSPGGTAPGRADGPARNTDPGPARTNESTRQLNAHPRGCCPDRGAPRNRAINASLTAVSSRSATVAPGSLPGGQSRGRGKSRRHSRERRMVRALAPVPSNSRCQVRAAKHQPAKAEKQVPDWAAVEGVAHQPDKANGGLDAPDDTALLHGPRQVPPRRACCHVTHTPLLRPRKAGHLAGCATSAGVPSACPRRANRAC